MQALVLILLSCLAISSARIPGFVFPNQPRPFRPPLQQAPLLRTVRRPASLSSPPFRSTLRSIDSLLLDIDDLPVASDKSIPSLSTLSAGRPKKDIRSSSLDYSGISNSCPQGSIIRSDGSCGEPSVTKNVYLYKAPRTVPKIAEAPQLPEPKFHYNYVFVRTQEDFNLPRPIVAPPTKQKTLVFVLNKNQEVQQQVIEVDNPLLDPEVFYLNYDEGDNPTLPGGIDLRTALQQAATLTGVGGHSAVDLSGSHGAVSFDDSLSSYGNFDDQLLVHSEPQEVRVKQQFDQVTANTKEKKSVPSNFVQNSASNKRYQSTSTNQQNSALGNILSSGTSIYIRDDKSFGNAVEPRLSSKISQNSGSNYIAKNEANVNSASFASAGLEQIGNVQLSSGNEFPSSHVQETGHGQFSTGNKGVGLSTVYQFVAGHENDFTNIPSQSSRDFSISNNQVVSANTHSQSPAEVRPPAEVIQIQPISSSALPTVYEEPSISFDDNFRTGNFANQNSHSASSSISSGFTAQTVNEPQHGVTYHAELPNAVPARGVLVRKSQTPGIYRLRTTGQFSPQGNSLTTEDLAGAYSEQSETVVSADSSRYDDEQDSS